MTAVGDLLWIPGTDSMEFNDPLDLYCHSMGKYVGAYLMVSEVDGNFIRFEGTRINWWWDKRWFADQMDNSVVDLVGDYDRAMGII